MQICLVKYSVVSRLLCIFSDKFSCNCCGKHRFFIAVKYEMYELISGYDKNKNYDKKLLNHYLKKISFRISTSILICSLIALFSPILSQFGIDKTLAVVYANLTFICVLLTILLTAKKNKI